MQKLIKAPCFSLLSIVVILCLFLCSCSRQPSLPRLSDNAVILAFGDSLTYGTGATPGESYPAVLEELTGKHVINAGVPGEISAEGLTRLPDVLDREKPSLLILCHGGNDLLRHLDQKETKQNLESMVRLAHNRNIAVLLIAVPAPGFLLRPPVLYKDVAENQKIPLEKDILENILSNGTLKSDYIHPNADGYRQLAEAVRNLMLKCGALN